MEKSSKVTIDNSEKTSDESDGSESSGSASRDFKVRFIKGLRWNEIAGELKTDQHTVTSTGRSNYPGGRKNDAISGERSPAPSLTWSQVSQELSVEPMIEEVDMTAGPSRGLSNDSSASDDSLPIDMYSSPPLGKWINPQKTPLRGTGAVNDGTRSSLPPTSTRKRLCTCGSETPQSSSASVPPWEQISAVLEKKLAYLVLQLESPYERENNQSPVENQLSCFVNYVRSTLATLDKESLVRAQEGIITVLMKEMRKMFPPSK